MFFVEAVWVGSPDAWMYKRGHHRPKGGAQRRKGRMCFTAEKFIKYTLQCFENDCKHCKIHKWIAYASDGKQHAVMLSAVSYFYVSLKTALHSSSFLPAAYSWNSMQDYFFRLYFVRRIPCTYYWYFLQLWI